MPVTSQKHCCSMSLFALNVEADSQFYDMFHAKESFDRAIDYQVAHPFSHV